MEVCIDLQNVSDNGFVLLNQASFRMFEVKLSLFEISLLVRETALHSGYFEVKWVLTC